MVLSLMKCAMKKVHQVPGTTRAGLTKPEQSQPRASLSDVWVAVGQLAPADLPPHLHATEATTGCRAICNHAGIRTTATAEAVLARSGLYLPNQQSYSANPHGDWARLRPRSAHTLWGMGCQGTELGPSFLLPSLLCFLPSININI